MAQQQGETLMTRWPMSSVDLVIDQPLVGAANRKRDGHQEVAAGKRHGQARKPWPGMSPMGGLAAENQAEDIEESSAEVFVGFQQITQYYLAFIPIEQPRS